MYGLMVCPEGCACAGGCTEPERDCTTSSCRELPLVRILGDLRVDTLGVGDSERDPPRAAARPLVTRFSESFPGGLYSWIFKVSAVVGGGKMIVVRPGRSCCWEGVDVRCCGTVGEGSSSFSPTDDRRRCSLT